LFASFIWPDRMKLCGGVAVVAMLVAFLTAISLVAVSWAVSDHLYADAAPIGSLLVAVVAFAVGCPLRRRGGTA
jgi:hypothetical protein